MPYTPLANSMMELLAHISLPAAERQFPSGDTAPTDPGTALPGTLTGPEGLIDQLDIADVTAHHRDAILGEPRE